MKLTPTALPIPKRPGYASRYPRISSSSEGADREDRTVNVASVNLLPEASRAAAVYLAKYMKNHHGA